MGLSETVSNLLLRGVEMLTNRVPGRPIQRRGRRLVVVARTLYTMRICPLTLFKN